LCAGFVSLDVWHSTSGMLWLGISSFPLVSDFAGSMVFFVHSQYQVGLALALLAKRLDNDSRENEDFDRVAGFLCFPC
jgi:hypothetical protein